MTTDDFAPIANNELGLCHYACVTWSNLELWTNYFSSIQEILGAEITHIDKNDPVRRRVKPGKLIEAADYVASFGKGEDSRWIFGKIDALGVEFSIRHYKDVRGWPNSINWYFPAYVIDRPASVEAIYRLFGHGNAQLSPFYAYADTQSNVSKKKKESGAIDIQAELVGAFWLTFFNTRYLAFIGKERFDKLDGIEVYYDGGATLRLAANPSLVPNGFREQVESQLSSELFVEPRDVLTKRPGQYALTFDNLRT